MSFQGKLGYIWIYTPSMVWQVENAKRFCSFSLTLVKPGKHFCSALPEMFSGVYGKKHSRALQLASERECEGFPEHFVARIHLYTNTRVEVEKKGTKKFPF